MKRNWAISLPSDFEFENHNIYVFKFVFAHPNTETPASAIHLSHEEKDRANRFYRLIDRNRFVVGRTIVRKALGKVFNQKPDSIMIQLADGRPFLGQQVKPEINFSISHSGDIVMVGICSGDRLGIDVEVCRNFKDIDAVAKNVMSNTEFNSYQKFKVKNRKEMFYRLWVRKESILKCMHRGFSLPPENITVGHDKNQRIRVHYEDEQFSVRHYYLNLSPDPHYWALALNYSSNLPEILTNSVIGEQ